MEKERNKKAARGRPDGGSDSGGAGKLLSALIVPHVTPQKQALLEQMAQADQAGDTDAWVDAFLAWLPLVGQEVGDG